MKKQLLILLALIVVMLTPQPSYSKHSFLTERQIKTLIKNNLVFLEATDKINNIHEDLHEIAKSELNAGRPETLNTFGGGYYFLIEKAIEESAIAFSYEMEATTLWLMLGTVGDDDQGRGFLRYRKKNLNWIKRIMESNIGLIGAYYSGVTNKSILHSYDKVKDIMRSVIAALDENIAIIQSVKETKEE